MTIRSRRGLVLGVIACTAVPITLLAIGRTPSGAPDATISVVASGEVVLGPLGLLLAGWAAGLNGRVTWCVYVAVAVPIVAIVWFAAIQSAIRTYPG